MGYTWSEAKGKTTCEKTGRGRNKKEKQREAGQRIRKGGGEERARKGREEEKAEAGEMGERETEGDRAIILTNSLRPLQKGG